MPFSPIFSLVYSCNVKKVLTVAGLCRILTAQLNASKPFKIFHRKFLLGFVMFVQCPEIQESILIPEKFICRITHLDM